MPDWKSHLNLSNFLVLVMALLGFSRNLGIGKCQSQALRPLGNPNNFSVQIGKEVVFSMLFG